MCLQLHCVESYVFYLSIPLPSICNQSKPIYLSTVYLPTFLKSNAWDFQFRRYPNFRRCPTTSEGFRRFPKVTEGFRRFPSITEDDPTTSDHTSCFDKLTNEFTLNWSTSKKLAFVSQAWELERMCEIRILDRQAWDSRIMRESWQVYDWYWWSIPIDNHTNLCHRLVINYKYQSISWYQLSSIIDSIDWIPRVICTTPSRNDKSKSTPHPNPPPK